MPEFEFCRQSLRSAFQKCTDVEFLRLSVIISCLLNCFSPLRVTDLNEILTLVFGVQVGSPKRSFHSEGSILQSLRLKCSQVLFEDSTGTLRFAHPLIPSFLLAYPIKGIDRSHLALAKACVTQIELSGGLCDDMKVAQPIPTTSSFLAYATANWQDHYRRVEKQNSSLTGRVHRMLWNAATGAKACGNYGQGVGLLQRRDALDEALSFCHENRFQVLSKAYSQSIAGLDAVLSVTNDGGACLESTEVRALEFDRAFAQLDIADCDLGDDYPTRV